MPAADIAKLDEVAGAEAGWIPSPIGGIVGVADPLGRLVGLDFFDTLPGDAHSITWRGARYPRNDAALAPVAEQLTAYFAGALRQFSLATAAPGNAFHAEVWAELTRIPYGETISYGELARRIGRPGAARAVGRANGSNPIAIVVPCHRVIGANGALTGYAGGIERKRALLALEQSTTPTGQHALW